MVTAVTTSPYPPTAPEIGSPVPPSVPDPAKKKVAQACETCRYRKVKCSGSRPVCTKCLKSRLSCTYASELRTRGRAKHPRQTSSVLASSASSPSKGGRVQSSTNDLKSVHSNPVVVVLKDGEPDRIAKPVSPSARMKASDTSPSASATTFPMGMYAELARYRMPFHLLTRSLTEPSALPHPYGLSIYRSPPYPGLLSQSGSELDKNAPSSPSSAPTISNSEAVSLFTPPSPSAMLLPMDSTMKGLEGVSGDGESVCAEETDRL